MTSLQLIMNPAPSLVKLALIGPATGLGPCAGNTLLQHHHHSYDHQRSQLLPLANSSTVLQSLFKVTFSKPDWNPLLWAPMVPWSPVLSVIPVLLDHGSTN